ncbi:glutaredoxin [Hypoxylon sp. FL1284]|nr:glutaredoxin [Hypoxylon sp. FL1284]
MSTPNLKEIATHDEWQAHLATLPKTALLVIFFHAPWAAPCAQMGTVLNALAEEYAKEGSPATSWVSVNAEELVDVSETYDVVAVPFVVLQRDSQVLDSISGSNAAVVRKAVEKHAPRDGTAAPTNGQTPAGETLANGEVGGELLSPEEELKKKLHGLVNAAGVMLFMKGTPGEPQCGFSRQMVGILRERSVKYGFFNILADDDVRQGLKVFADWPTYPQLWVAGELVGGLDIVKEELENDPDYFAKYSVPKTQTAGAA